MSSEVRITDPKTGGQKGQKDERFDLIPYDALEELARVYGVGAKKYADDNWIKGYAWRLSAGALLRHVSRWMIGEDRDKETGCHHLAHAAWHCLTLLTFSMRNLGTDDRAPAVKPSDPDWTEKLGYKIIGVDATQVDPSSKSFRFPPPHPDLGATVEGRLVVTDLCDVRAFSKDPHVRRRLERAINLIEGRDCFTHRGRDETGVVGFTTPNPAYDIPAAPWSFDLADEGEDEVTSEFEPDPFPPRSGAV